MLGKYSNRIWKFGINEVQLWRVGQLYLVKSGYEIPGRSPSPALTGRFKCKDRRIRLRTVRGLDSQSNERICAVAHAALQYIVDTFDSDGISLELDMVPPERNLLRRRSAIGVKPKITLGIATFDDPSLTFGNVADTVAHESFHMLLAKLGPDAKADDEYSARYFGLCGQLLVAGKIMKDQIPGSWVSPDDSLASSAVADAAIRREVVPLFQGESLLAGSDGANRILEQCHRLASLPGRVAPSRLTP